MKIRTGDTVLVISGKDKGKTGVVMRVLATASRLVVEGINMRTRHMRKTQQQAGQKIRYEASLHVSNVMVLDPKTKKPTRIHYRIDPKTGHKQRVAAVSGEVIAKAAKTQGKKKTEGAETTKKTETAETKKTTKKAADDTASTPPKRDAFWKRMTRRGPAQPNETDEVRADDKGAHPTMPKVHRSRESS